MKQASAGMLLVFLIGLTLVTVLAEARMFVRITQFQNDRFTALLHEPQ
jgi:hypothetical protein